jgi:hypothetical protein
MYLANDARRDARYDIAKRLDRTHFTDLTRVAIRDFEPNVPWNEEFLTTRANCYATVGDPLAILARREADEFLANEPPTYNQGLSPTGP